MFKILIADDHAVLRMGLKQLVSEECAICEHAEFGEAQNGQEVLDLTRQERWDLVLLDISMPGRDGMDVLNELHHMHPELRILVLSMYPEDQYAVRALKMGACGYLTKDSAPEELAKAIDKIMDGGKYVSPELAEKLAFDLGTPREGPEKLSFREHQVLRMIASGRTVSEIAGQLSLSVKTISTYRVRILEKMRMKNNAELTHYAVHNRLVD
ncbi:MAG: DNA-binding response regulator [Chloroflexi bacterium RBG_16_56_8]|nr:MAG: DNA-binding response regulator [Chloroflexi bacterium RBG_16_56_8]